MTKNVIGFFCGTGFTRKNDKLYEIIRSSINISSTTFLAYDGCHVYGGGLFAFGVETQADVFITDLKKEFASCAQDEHIQMNLIAHSQGCLSALLAIKKIQADRELGRRVNITVDLHDPLPRNFRWSSAVGGRLMIVNQVYDLSDCDFVKKAYITIQEQGLGTFAWDSLIPKFHTITKIAVEALPGCHDVQHSGQIRADLEHIALFQLGQAKTLELLKEDGHEISVEEDALRRQQIDAYKRLLAWAKNRSVSFANRALHFGGNILANNYEKERMEAINWRHAQLIAAVPEHVLYGITHPYYNYKKTDLEYYCDLTLALDRYLATHPEQSNLAQELVDLAQTYVAEGHSGLKKFYTKSQELLTQASVQDKQLYIALNSMCIPGYFHDLEASIGKIPRGSALYERLISLKAMLIEELDSEIRTGVSIQHIQEANALKTANHTVHFLQRIYSENSTSDCIIRAVTDYLNANSHWGKNWSLTAKIIAGLILSVAAVAVGCMVGAAIGYGMGLTLISFLGMESLVSCVFASFCGGSVGAALGLGIGVVRAHTFFAHSAIDKQVHQVADIVSNQLLTQ